MTDADMTERQRKWFASVREGLERDTGRTLAEWVVIARTCPETAHRKRLAWFKENHGLLQNRASQVLDAAFPSSMGWSSPEDLKAALWVDAGSDAIRLALDAELRTYEGVIQTARRGFAAWSRRVQFAALRPLKGGKAMLGVAAQPGALPCLSPRGSESWSERLSSRTTLQAADEINDALKAILRAAWENA